MKRFLTALMIGDIVSQSGLRALFMKLPELRKKLKADIVVANGENASSGFGITAEDAGTIFQCGVDVISSGNHVWEKKGHEELLSSDAKILRPANYPPGVAGKGFLSIELGQASWLVVNLQGRESMSPIDCPFRTAQEIIKRSHKAGQIVIVDFHAEAAEEKEALAQYLDGEVGALAGTHTHVQTMDERILPKGTGYITDLGMTGAVDSIIGMKTDICLRRSLSQMPIKMEAAEGEAQLQGALFTFDLESRRCVAIERVKA